MIIFVSNAIALCLPCESFAAINPKWEKAVKKNCDEASICSQKFKTLNQDDKIECLAKSNNCLQGQIQRLQLDINDLDLQVNG